MGVPNSEVGYASAMPRREDHEVRKGHVGALDKKKGGIYVNLKSICQIHEVKIDKYDNGVNF